VKRIDVFVEAELNHAAMAIEDRQQVILAATKDVGVAMTAFIEQRPPVYRGG
jgi:hypothetical protein